MILNVRSTSGGIETGAAYRRHGMGAVVEMATVLGIVPDKMGIPHVRYQLQVIRGNGVPTVENRTLALEVFQNRYRERVAEDRGQASDIG
jgi:hypothetical protein